jgi:hypothetical protein
VPSPFWHGRNGISQVQKNKRPKRGFQQENKELANELSEKKRAILLL